MELGSLGFEDRDDVGEAFGAFGADGFAFGFETLGFSVPSGALGFAFGALVIGHAVLDLVRIDTDLGGAVLTDMAADTVLIDDRDMVHDAHAALGADTRAFRERGDQAHISVRVMLRHGRRRHREEADDAGGADGLGRGVHGAVRVGCGRVAYLAKQMP